MTKLKTTTEVIKDCFKKAKMSGANSKYLFKILSAAMEKEFIKRRRKFEEDAIFNLVMDGYSISFADYEIKAASEAFEYNGDKDLVVEGDRYCDIKPRGFNTIKGAMKYIDNQQ